MRAALAAVGAKSWQVSGDGLPDLIVRFQRQWYCAEVKTAKGTLTDSQGDFPVWRTNDDALRAIGVKQ